MEPVRNYRASYTYVGLCTYVRSSKRGVATGFLLLLLIKVVQRELPKDTGCRSPLSHRWRRRCRSQPHSLQQWARKGEGEKGREWVVRTEWERGGKGGRGTQRRGSTANRPPLAPVHTPRDLPVTVPLLRGGELEGLLERGRSPSGGDPRATATCSPAVPCLGKTRRPPRPLTRQRQRRMRHDVFLLTWAARAAPRESQALGAHQRRRLARTRRARRALEPKRVRVRAASTRGRRCRRCRHRRRRRRRRRRCRPRHRCPRGLRRRRRRPGRPRRRRRRPRPVILLAWSVFLLA